MKRCSAIAAAIILQAGAVHAQFEGVVRMRAVTFADAESTVVSSSVYFKGQLFAAVIDSSDMTEGRGGKFILRGDKKIMWIIVDQEKKYMEIPLADKGRPADAPPKSGETKSYTLTRSGKSRSIIGYKCEEWTADEGEGETASIWATAELGNMYEGIVKWFDEMSMESATDGTRWERELADRKLFPLIVVRARDGEVTETEEVTAVERKNVPATTFEAPAGYEKQVVDLNFEKMFEEMMKKMGDEGGGDADSTSDEDDDGGGF